MRALLIAAVAAVIGMLFTSLMLALTSPNTYEANASTAVAMSDAELDAYISELIDRQLADVIERRMGNERVARSN
ncbi:MAG: hypothetical protein AAFX94_16390 [Myxococcota bacterium]